jgi:hypothetical protein
VNFVLKKVPRDKKEWIGIRIASPSVYDVSRHLWEIGEVTNGKTLNYKTLKPETAVYLPTIWSSKRFSVRCGKHKTQENLKFVLLVASSTSHHEVDAIKWVGLN